VPSNSHLPKISKDDDFRDQIHRYGMESQAPVELSRNQAPSTIIDDDDAITESLTGEQKKTESYTNH
jgi:hypothetical protein